MLRLYNTLTRCKEWFRPAVEGRVGIYTCGPTLHDHAHVGLIRRLLAVDMLKRLLMHEGYQVRHIVNLTDVDDKTIAESARRGVRLDELTGLYATEFFEDVATLRMFPADHYPRASEHVEDMVAMTRKLVDAGLAYEMQRSVYYDISRFPGYGRLSKIDLKGVKAGATVELDYYEKDHPGDFTVMRRSDLAELRRRISWATDWGQVRPGWHIECAAMARKYLGDTFDIHTSGQDLAFPHNENENALCEGLTGKPMARYWMHSGLIKRDGRKMSRSAGSAVTLRDLVGRGYTGSQVRWFLLGIHYRRPLDFGFDALDTACRELARLDDLIRNLRLVALTAGQEKEIDDLVVATDRAFFTAMRDDLNLPRAKAALFDLVKVANGHIADGTISQYGAQLALDFLYRADRVLAVMDFSAGPAADAGIDALLAERDAARQAGDYSRADEIRLELAVLGVAVEDTPGGARIRTRTRPS
jgi:cysteinyl-tRNA synthetase